MKQFEPQIFRQTLAHDIVVVAKTRIEGTWKAYIGSTKERRHEDAVPVILMRGAPVHEAMARALFPHFKDLPCAR